MAAIAAAAGVSLWSRAPLKLDVMRDRASLAREVAGGRIENVYRLQVMNTEERARRFTLRASGAPGLGRLELLADTPTFELAPLDARTFTVRLRAEAGASRGAHRIQFELVSSDPGARPVDLEEASRFLVP
jgi:polyferredoxin